MLRSKAPTHNDGVVKIYEVANIAPPGSMPKEGLTLKETLRYYERTVGINRYYAALQANAKIKYVLRCPRRRNVSSQDVAIPNDGEQYRITLIQYPENSPSEMDLTLEAVTAKYDIG